MKLNMKAFPLRGCFIKRVLLIGIAYFLLTASKAQTITILPANPVKLESVIARTTYGACTIDRNVLCKSNKLT